MRRGLLIFSVAALALGLVASYGNYFNQASDFASDLVRDIDRKFYRALGWPLRGTPDLARLEERLREKGLQAGAPVFIRIFKQEYELELWMKKGETFTLFATYPICTYSGELGPKERQGDRQAPEGFYTVSKAQLNPNSRWHRSFNLGYPNLHDASHARTGDFLMVHGGCGSIGCYAMTNPAIDEIWALITAALDKGQERFAVHAFPFRMEDWRLAAHAGGPWDEFWADLKRGHDLFEKTSLPPEISVCRKRYVAAPGKRGTDGSAPLRTMSACADPSAAASGGRKRAGG